MNIVFVITGLGVGGAEKVVVTLASSLAGLGHKVRIAYLTEPALSRPSNQDVEVLLLKVTRTPLGLLRGLRKLAKSLAAEPPDVINAHLFHAIILTRIWKVVFGRTFAPILVSSLHNSREGGRLRQVLFRFTTLRSECLTHVSVDGAETLESKGFAARNSFGVLPNGIDTKLFRFDPAVRSLARKDFGAEDGDVVILSVGRLEAQKDFSNMLRAFSTLLPQHKNLLLVIVGTGTLKLQLAQEAEGLGIQHRVRFLGMRLDMAKLYSGADVFAHSSAWEGFGLVVAEAMACERVVVATDSGGVAHVIGSGGFIVQASNDAALADGIRKALNLSADEKEKLVKKARERIVKSFSSISMVNNYESLYQSLLLRSDDVA